jgi:hypothetical protein
MIESDRECDTPEVEEVENPVSISQLRNTTWSYDEVGFVGFIGAEYIPAFLFDAFEGPGNENHFIPQLVTACNVEKGWVEQFVLTVPFDPAWKDNEWLDYVKKGKDGFVKERIDCIVNVKVMDRCGNVLLIID